MGRHLRSDAQIEALLADISSVKLHQFLGLEFADVADGKAAAHFSPSPNALTFLNTVHGGSLYLLMDAVAAAAAASSLDRDKWSSTVDLHVSVLRAPSPDATIEFEAEVVRLGRRLVFVDVRALSQGREIATARITKAVVTA